MNCNKGLYDNSIEFDDYGMLPSFRRIIYEPDILEHVENPLELDRFYNKIQTSEKNKGTFMSKDEYKKTQTADSYTKQHIYDFNLVLGKSDIFTLIQAIKEVKGIGFIKILPYGYHE